jgi:hypothetical protein
MPWTIDFPISPFSEPISHQSKILSMGSCFAETIGTKMKNAKFDVLVNPFGTIFHPLNLTFLLDAVIFRDALDPEGIVEREGLYSHYSFHSDLVAKSPEELADLYHRQIQSTYLQLHSASHLILTLGTAWIYEHETFGQVANCHKQPQRLFQKKLSELEEMKTSFSHVLHNISQVFPRLKIVLTVSPVRHIKDGVSENQLSKSLLRVLCAELEKSIYPVSYFPAYEIMMDELRDYRFYKSDKIHPSEEAEEYIWQKWQLAVFDEVTREKVATIQKVKLDLAHRPFNPDSDSHQKFLKNLLVKLERLNAEFDFSEEIVEVKKQIQ